MDIIWIKAVWGMTESTLEAKLHRIQENGYDGIEMGAPADDAERREAIDLLDKMQLRVVAQQWSRGRDIEEHLDTFEEQVRHNAELNPILINSHTGRDIFRLEDNLRMVERAHELEKELGIEIAHEIHRGRMTFCSNSTMELLDAAPELKLTADFSHWCCVHESLLADQQDRVERAMRRSIHIHARVGHTQGSQVTHPGAPEWKETLDAHVTWWKDIVDLRRKEGRPVLTICPEFGPAPYMPALPFTNQPVVDLWSVNLWMKEYLTKSGGF